MQSFFRCFYLKINEKITALFLFCSVFFVFFIFFVFYWCLALFIVIRDYRLCLFISPIQKKPQRFLVEALFYFLPGGVLLSHGESPHYHRRYSVSLLSSAWNQVGPLHYRRQDNSFDDFTSFILMSSSFCSFYSLRLSRLSLQQTPHPKFETSCLLYFSALTLFFVLSSRCTHPKPKRLRLYG